MRLYRIDHAGGSAWFGTQADANQGRKDHGAAWVEVDVDTGKQPLLALLNELGAGGGVTYSGKALELIAPAPPAAPPRVPADYAARAVFEEDLWAAMSLPEQLHFAALAMERARRARYSED